MLRYFSKRLALLIPKLLIISLIVFFALQALPGDALSRSVPPRVYQSLSETQLEALRESLGLNEPLFTQYFRWLSNMLHGDFGYSQSTGSNIGQMLMARLPSTIELVFFALIIASFFGILFGFIAALNQNTPLDYINTGFSIVGISVPEFFFGLIFILLFSVRLGWLPSGGRMAPGQPGFFERLPYMIMPAFCLAISLMATLSRYTRSTMLDVLGRDYVKTARSKGLRESRVTLKHVFRNALTPIMVIMVMRLPMLVSGAVVIEAVFNYPGMGSMILDAVSAGDMPVVMITTMVVAAVTLAASCVVDLFTALLDPRIRFGE
ncbi:MAG: ABC transporter permease [Oscillospiraceae bacterium]|nr:ABC transporter permease [Oscillospiraceae bacterium]